MKRLPEYVTRQIKAATDELIQEAGYTPTTEMEYWKWMDDHYSDVIQRAWSLHKAFAAKLQIPVVRDSIVDAILDNSASKPLI